MKRQPLSRFLPDAGQVLQLVNQPGNGFREIRHGSRVAQASACALFVF
jgi:hypothetical protein